MNEKELTTTLSLLKRIEPRKEWVIFVKTRIFADINADARGNSIGQVWQVGHIIDTFALILRKPAFAMAGFGLVIALGVLFQFNQQRLAQDATAQLALAQERLEQLQKIAGSANKGDLSLALKEFQETSAKLSRQVPEFAAKDHSKALQAGITIIQLQKSAQGLEKVFGVSVGEKTQGELQVAVKTLIENELADLETRTLSAEQQVLFGQAKAAFEAGDYESALGKIWEVSN
ncbi:MAG: hypothetical protein AABX60_04055 [Nanoarchaeota archaeon]